MKNLFFPFYSSRTNVCTAREDNSQSGAASAPPENGKCVLVCNHHTSVCFDVLSIQASVRLLVRQLSRKCRSISARIRPKTTCNHPVCGGSNSTNQPTVSIAQPFIKGCEPNLTSPPLCTRGQDPLSSRGQQPMRGPRGRRCQGMRRGGQPREAP